MSTGDEDEASSTDQLTPAHIRVTDVEKKIKKKLTAQINCLLWRRQRGDEDESFIDPHTQQHRPHWAGKKRRKTMAKMMKTATALDRLANYAHLSAKQKACLEKWLDANAADAQGATPSRAPQIFGAAKQESPKTGKADRTYAAPQSEWVMSGLVPAPQDDIAKAIKIESTQMCAKIIPMLSAKSRAIVEAKPHEVVAKYSFPLAAFRIYVHLQSLCPIALCCAWGENIAKKLGLSRANALFGSPCNSLMWEKCADKSKSLPFIRIRYNLSTLGTSLPRFDTVSDVESYYRDPARIAEVANLCEFWLAQFEEKVASGKATQKATPKAPEKKAEKKGAEYYLSHPDELRALLSGM